jgi:hypothetical protein
LSKLGLLGEIGISYLDIQKKGFGNEVKTFEEIFKSKITPRASQLTPKKSTIEDLFYN